VPGLSVFRRIRHGYLPATAACALALAAQGRRQLLHKALSVQFTSRC